ncbi:MAG: enoyl-CoA hydratase/isomerase family protein [Thermoanaerobaculia bacterium]
MTAFWAIEREGPVSRFRLDSDDGRQTLSPELLEDLAAGAAAECARGSAVVSIESARPGIFAAGADLLRIRGLSGPEAHAYARRGQDAISALGRVPAAVVAAIDGACFGGALDLAMGCDVRLSSHRSRFCHPGPRLGFITGWGGTVRAPRLLGAAGARRLFRTGEVFDASFAANLGLIDEVIAVAAWKARRGEIEECLARERPLWETKPWI